MRAESVPRLNQFPDGNFYSRDWEDGEAGWSQETLWEAAKGLVPKQVDLRFFSKEDVEAARHNLKTPFEVERVHRADLSYPIIMHAGGIIDGFHRLAKILHSGEDTATIVELDEMPPPDFIVSATTANLRKIARRIAGCL